MILYLSSLYARLGECSRNNFCSIDRYDIVTYLDASFFHMLLWERFSAMSPKSVDFKVVKPEKVIINGEKK